MAGSNWKLDGTCSKIPDAHYIFDAVEVEIEPDVFIDTYPQLDTAKAICSGCPVFAICNTRRKSERSGIWAGKPARY